MDEYVTDYDGLNRVSQVEELLAGAVQNTTSFTYNEVGAPLTRTRDDSHAEFTYNARNLLTSVANCQIGVSVTWSAVQHAACWSGDCSYPGWDESAVGAGTAYAGAAGAAGRRVGASAC